MESNRVLLKLIQDDHFQICKPPKNITNLQLNHKLYYECLCGDKLTQNSSLFHHFKKMHSNQ